MSLRPFAWLFVFFSFHLGITYPAALANLSSLSRKIRRLSSPFRLYVQLVDMTTLVSPTSRTLYADRRAAYL